jgi:hypothetical protein
MTATNGGAAMNDFDSVSDAAMLAHRSLSHRPDLNTPQLIDEGPCGVDQIGAEQIAEGLSELAAMDPPRVVERADGWHLVSRD